MTPGKHRDGTQDPGDMPVERAVPTCQPAYYVVLTTPTPDSGLVFGGISAVARAEAVRLLDGPGAPGALRAVYIRLADALVPVDVEATALPSSDGVARFRVRAWLQQQLLGQHDLEIAPGEC